MQKKKNGFLLFCFSFLPGAGEMYMGFMKMGLSLLGLFLASVCVVSIIGMPEFAVIPALIYVYSFFHAHNVAGLSDEKFNALEDEYLFGTDNLGKIGKSFKGKNKKWVAYACIILGIVMVWQASLEVLWDRLGSSNYIVKLLYSISDYAPRFLIGLVIIVVGIRLIAGKKTDTDDLEDNQ